MRHRYDCPLRWGDQDLFHHVNNVRYVDYLQEARGALLRACLEAAGVERGEGDGYVVVRHEVSFRAPLKFRKPTVAIESWVSEVRAAGFTLDHEIFHDTDEGRVVYLRARTVLAPFVVATGTARRLSDLERAALEPYREDGERSLPLRTAVPRDRAGHYPVHVRFSDLDVYRHVNNVMYYEYFQEARIALMRDLAPALKQFGRIAVVVAQGDVEYHAPMTLRHEPYDCWTSVSRVGSRSMTVDSEIVDPTGATGRDGVVARGRFVLVFFDLETERSVSPPEGYGEAIQRAVAALGGAEHAALAVELAE
ncbi:acyl-CoA thioesterase [Nocardioides sp. zg-536]|uniref:Acyl-CoA thioesterase n=1 Tax=Nocardioides faecalis TaxID=2803858 RepID=A0A938Y7K3_9ACTN|nr:acyl-CoA thioesterase [Nocardioides faecalis]MBS4752669.1 acyl-CoA thioesterase [Nocardioides faecalis]QVI60665.1 acyl-CoA thioesterase [Nocardioides faecalis]